MSAARLAPMLQAVATAAPGTVCEGDPADFERCPAHVITDRRDVNPDLLEALMLPSPAAVLARDNRGCTPLHILLMNPALSHAFTKQLIKVQALETKLTEVVAQKRQQKVEENIAAILLQQLARCWVVQRQLRKTYKAKLQRAKSKLIGATRIGRALADGKNELEPPEASNESSDDQPSTGAEDEQEQPVQEHEEELSEEEASERDTILQELQAAVAKIGAIIEATSVKQSQNWAYFHGLDLPPLLALTRSQISETIRREGNVQCPRPETFDAGQKVDELSPDPEDERSISVMLTPLKFVAKHMKEERELEWDLRKLAQNQSNLFAQMMHLEDGGSLDDIPEEDESHEQYEGFDDDNESEVETLLTQLRKELCILADAENDVVEMVNVLVQAGRKVSKKMNVMGIEDNAGRKPLRVLLANDKVAPPVMASLLHYMRKVEKTVVWQAPLSLPNRNPLHILVADREDLTNEMIAALVTAGHNEVATEVGQSAQIEDGYGFRALRLLLERQGLHRIGKDMLPPMLRTLVIADPTALVQKEVAEMSNSALSKRYRAEIGRRCGRTCLHLICERDDVSQQMIRAMVHPREDLILTDVCDVQDDQGRTPLHTLCENEAINDDILRELISMHLGAAAVANNEGLTPLQTLCRYNKHITVGTVQLLASVNLGDQHAAGIPDERGQTAVHLLCLRRDIPVNALAMMLEVLAREAPNELTLQDSMSSSTPLHYVCKRSDVTLDMVSTLIRHNPRAAAIRDSRGKTPLHWLRLDPKADTSFQRSQADKDKREMVDQVHVRHIGQSGWDGTVGGRGTYENVEALTKIFSKFGTVVGATIRHRINKDGKKMEDEEMNTDPSTRVDNGENTSWALVTMSDKAGVDRVVNAKVVMAGDTALKCTRYSKKWASKKIGVGKSKQIMQAQVMMRKAMDLLNCFLGKLPEKSLRLPDMDRIVPAVEYSLATVTVSSSPKASSKGQQLDSRPEPEPETEPSNSTDAPKEQVPAQRRADSDFDVIDALSIQDKNGITVLHTFCRRNDLSPDELTPIIQALAEACPNLVGKQDCPREPSARSFLNGVYLPDRTPLHDLLRRDPVFKDGSSRSERRGGGITAELLHALLKHFPRGAQVVDCFGRTPAFLLCTRSDFSPLLRQTLLNELCKHDAGKISLGILDDLSNGPLHNLCKLSNVSTHMLKTVAKANSDALEIQDAQGMTALMYLCANAAVDLPLVTALLDIKSVEKAAADDTSSPSKSDKDTRPVVRLAAEHESRLRAMFYRIDRNQDGSVSRNELEQGVSDDGELAELLGLPKKLLTYEDQHLFSTLFSEMDANVDGHIEIDEFVRQFASENIVTVKTIPTVTRKSKRKARTQQRVTEQRKALDVEDGNPFNQQKPRPSSVSKARLPDRLNSVERTSTEPTGSSTERPNTCAMQLIVRGRGRLQAAGSRARAKVASMRTETVPETRSQIATHARSHAEVACAVVADVQGRTALHFLCMNADVPNERLVPLVALLCQVAERCIAMLTRTPPCFTPVHLSILRNNLHPDVFRSLLEANPQAAKIQTDTGWYPLQMVVAKPSISCLAMGPILDTIAKAYPRAVNLPPPVGLVGNHQSLHSVCDRKDVCIEAIAPLAKYWKEATTSQDEHRMTPLHYLCKNTCLCHEVTALHDKLAESSDDVQQHVFGLMHRLLSQITQAFIEFADKVATDFETEQREMQRMQDKAGLVSDPVHAAEQFRKECLNSLWGRELPPLFLEWISGTSWAGIQSKRGSVSKQWRYHMRDTVLPLCRRMERANKMSPEVNDIPKLVATLYFPSLEQQDRKRLLWRSLSADLQSYIADLERLVESDWADDNDFEKDQFPESQFPFAAAKAAGYYAKGMAAHDGHKIARTIKHKAVVESEAQEFARTKAQLTRSGESKHFGVGRSPIFGQANRDGAGNVLKTMELNTAKANFRRRTMRSSSAKDRKKRASRARGLVKKAAKKATFVLQAGDILDPQLEMPAVADFKWGERVRVLHTDDRWYYALVTHYTPQEVPGKPWRVEFEFEEGGVGAVLLTDELHRVVRVVDCRLGDWIEHWTESHGWRLATVTEYTPLGRSTPWRVAFEYGDGAGRDTVELSNAHNRVRMGPMFCVGDRIDVAHRDAWHAATVTAYTPRFEPHPWRVEYVFDRSGATAASLLEDNRDRVRRAFFRVGDEVTVKFNDGHYYDAVVTSYVLPGSTEPWRVTFNFVEGGSSALLLDDEFHHIKVKPPPPPAKKFVVGEWCVVEQDDGEALYALVTEYTPQNQREPWRVGFEYDDSSVEAILLDDELGHSRIHNGPEFRVGERVDVIVQDRAGLTDWQPAKVTAYTPPNQSEPWRVEYQFGTGGATGAVLLDDSPETIRRAHFRIDDEVFVEHSDGHRYIAWVTSYTHQGLPEPWRVGFEFEAGGDGALILSDDFHRIRRRKPELLPRKQFTVGTWCLVRQESGPALCALVTDFMPPGQHDPYRVAFEYDDGSTGAVLLDDEPGKVNPGPDFRVGERIDARYEGSWYPAIVQHYSGPNSADEEWRVEFTFEDGSTGAVLLKDDSDSVRRAHFRPGDQVTVDYDGEPYPAEVISFTAQKSPEPWRVAFEYRSGGEGALLLDDEYHKIRRKKPELIAAELLAAQAALEAAEAASEQPPAEPEPEPEVDVNVAAATAEDEKAASQSRSKGRLQQAAKKAVAFNLSLLANLENVCIEKVQALAALHKKHDEATRDCAAMIEALCMAGPAATTMCNNYGRTPVHYLAMNAFVPPRVLPKLLTTIVKPQPQVLHMRAISTVTVTIKGQDELVPRQLHRSPISCVVQRPDLTAAMILACLEFEPDGKAADVVDYYGNTPLHTVCGRSLDLPHQTLIECAIALVSASSTSLTVTNTEGASPLHILMEQKSLAPETLSLALRSLCDASHDAIAVAEAHDDDDAGLPSALRGVRSSTARGLAAGVGSRQVEIGDADFGLGEWIEIWDKHTGWAAAKVLSYTPRGSGRDKPWRVGFELQDGSLGALLLDDKATQVRPGPLYKVGDRIDVLFEGRWHEATINEYTAPGQSEPWRVGFVYDEGGAMGAVMLDSDSDRVRRAHYRVGDRIHVDAKEDGRWYDATVTGYTPQGLSQPWRVQFDFDTEGYGAVMLDDEYHRVRHTIVQGDWHRGAKLEGMMEKLQVAENVTADVEAREARARRRGANGGITARTPLHILCERTDITTELLRRTLRGPYGNNTAASARDSEGRTPLHCLCENRVCALDLVQTFVNSISQEEGAQAMCPNRLRLTPLHVLCKGYRVGPNVGGDKQSSDLPELLKILVALDRTAVLSFDAQMFTPLLHVVRRDDITCTMVEALLDGHRLLPSHIADAVASVESSMHGSSEATALAECSPGAAAEGQDSQGRTALHVLCGATTLTLALLRSVLARDPACAGVADDGGLTPLHILCRRAQTPELTRHFGAEDMVIAARLLAHCRPSGVIEQERLRLGTTAVRIASRTCMHDVCARGLHGRGCKCHGCSLMLMTHEEAETVEISNTTSRRIPPVLSSKMESLSPRELVVRALELGCSELEVKTAKESETGRAALVALVVDAELIAAERTFGAPTAELVQLIASILSANPAVGTLHDARGLSPLHHLIGRRDMDLHSLPELLRAYTSACPSAAAAHVDRVVANELDNAQRWAEDAGLDTHGEPKLNSELNWQWGLPNVDHREHSGSNEVEQSDQERLLREWATTAEGMVDAFTLADKTGGPIVNRHAGWTPAHELCVRPHVSADLVEALGPQRGAALTVQNMGGRTPLHVLLYRPDLDTLARAAETAEALVRANPSCLMCVDSFSLGLGRGQLRDKTPLAVLCARPTLVDELLLLSVIGHDFAECAQVCLVPDREGRLPLHLLLTRSGGLPDGADGVRRGGVSLPATLLASLVFVEPQSIAVPCPCLRDANALHMLAQRPDVNGELMLALLCGGTARASAHADGVLCAAAAQAALMVTSPATTPTAARTRKEGESRHRRTGWTPLHTLAANAAVDVPAMHALCQSVPKASVVRDSVGRLPLHVLLENVPRGPAEKLAAIVGTLASVEASSIGTKDFLHEMSYRHSGVVRASDGARAHSTTTLEAERMARKLLHATKAGDHILNRTPLHVLCDRKDVSAPLLSQLAAQCPQATLAKDQQGRTPLHRLAINGNANLEMLTALVEHGRGALGMQTTWGRTPLATSCFNRGVPRDRLPSMLGFLARMHPSAMLLRDIHLVAPKRKGDRPQPREDRTPLLVLCQRPDVNAAMLSSVLAAEPQAAVIPDGLGATPLVTISRRRDLSPKHVMKLRAVLEVAIAQAVANERASLGLQ
jgi:ankyrin repeat protein